MWAQSLGMAAEETECLLEFIHRSQQQGNPFILIFSLLIIFCF